MVADTDGLISRARLKLVLALGVLIALLYGSALRHQQLTVYEIAMLALLTVAALAFDYFKIGQILANFRKERAKRPHDQAIRVALNSALQSSFLKKLLETNLLTLYYAFFAKYETSTSQESGSFSYTKSSNAYDVFLFVAISQLPFLPFIHVLIEYKKGPAIAWVITLITLWSVIWYLAQVQAGRCRPIELSDRQLRYRFGLFWTADIPLSSIRLVRSIDVTENLDRMGLFLSPFGSARNVLLEFETPVQFSGPYFIRKRRKKAAFSLDDPQRFIHELALRGVPTGGGTSTLPRVIKDRR